MSDECVAESDQSMTIPKGWFVVNCDFDNEENPTCTICDGENVLKDVGIKVPKALAYWLRTHGCGSQKMRELIYEQGKRQVQGDIKEALGIGEQA